MFNFVPAEPKRKADSLPTEPIGQAALKKHCSENKHIIKKLRKYMEKLNEVCLQNDIEHEYIESLPELIDIAAEHIKLDDFEDMLGSIYGMIVVIEQEQQLGNVVNNSNLNFYLNKIKKWSSVEEPEEAPPAVPNPVVAPPAVPEPPAQVSSFGVVGRLPKEGDTVIVRCVNPKAKLSKLKKLLNNGPEEWILRGLGADTATFAIKRGASATTFTVLLSDIEMKVVKISKPNKWLDNLLVEVRYYGDPTWYLYRNRMLPDKQVLVEDIPLPVEEIEFEPNSQEYGSSEWQESDDRDTWRWPEYFEMVPGDIIQVLDNENKWVNVEVMDLEEDHIAICEFRPKRSKRKSENQLVVDSWYRQVKKGEVSSSSKSSSRVVRKKESSDDDWDMEQDAESEDEFEDASYVEEDEITFRGVEYVIDERYLIKDDDGEIVDIGYVLEPKGAESKQQESIRISQSELINTNWNPEFQLDLWVMFEGSVYVIKGYKFDSKKYLIVSAEDEDDDKAELIEADGDQFSNYNELTFRPGQHVVFDFELHRIQYVDHIHLCYTLIGNDQILHEGISEDELRRWCLYQAQATKKNPNPQPIICFIDKMVDKSVKRNKVSVIKSHYRLIMSREEYDKKITKQKYKTKDIIVGSKSAVKTQEEIELYLERNEEEDEEEDAGNQYVRYNPQDRVMVYGADGDRPVSYRSGAAAIEKEDSDYNRMGTVLKFYSNEKLEREEYLILVDGDESPVRLRVGTFGYPLRSEEVIEEEEEEEETYEDGDIYYYPDDDSMWKVEGDETNEIVKEEDKEVEDKYGQLWICIEDKWQHYDDINPGESTDEEVDEADYENGKLVADADGNVYRVTGYSKNKYTIESVTDESNTKEVSVEDIGPWEPIFQAGNVVTVNDGTYTRYVIDEILDGVYSLIGVSDPVSETDLEQYIAPMITGSFVRFISGSREIYKVVSFSSGTYTLKNVADDTSFTANIDEVIDYESPEFQKNDFVQIIGNSALFQVKTVITKKGSYKITNVSGSDQIIRESQLQEAAPPKFCVFDDEKEKWVGATKVSVRDHPNVYHTIFKVDRLKRLYTLDKKDGPVVSEEDLSEAYDSEDEDDL